MEISLWSRNPRCSQQIMRDHRLRQRRGQRIEPGQPQHSQHIAPIPPKAAGILRDQQSGEPGFGHLRPGHIQRFANKIGKQARCHIGQQSAVIAHQRSPFIEALGL